MPKDSFLPALVIAFLQSFTRTVKEIVTHILLGFATVGWSLANHVPEASVWEVFVPLFWLLSAEIIWHAVKAARSLTREVSSTPVASRILSDRGQPIYLNKPSQPFRAKVWLAAALTAAFFISFSLLVGIVAKHSSGALPKTNVAPSVPPAIEIFADCGMTSLPISISPQSSAHVLGLNRKFMLSQHWGLSDIPNRTDREMQWPSKKVLNDLAKQRETGEFGYKCDISNHSQIGIVEAAITMTFWYDGQAGGDNIKYAPIVSPLDSGAHFVFYIFNECPVRVSAVLPADITVTANDAHRKVPLYLPHRSPLEPIMMFFPSKTQWLGQQPCS